MSKAYQVNTNTAVSNEYQIDIGEDTLEIGDKVIIEWDDESRLDATVLVAFGNQALVKIV